VQPKVRPKNDKGNVDFLSSLGHFPISTATVEFTITGFAKCWAQGINR
jgi:hypothetical protein